MKIGVGYGSATSFGVAPASLSALGDEGFLITSSHLSPQVALCISGARAAPRGTLYGMQKYLEILGFRFYAYDDTVTPSITHPLPAFELTHTPTMEFRDGYGWAALGHLDWTLQARFNWVRGR